MKDITCKTKSAIHVPNSDLYTMPERYRDVERVGMAMSPDMELLVSMKPDLILSPNSLQPDLSQRYEAAGLTGYFCDMRSVDGMYQTIAYLGELFDRRDQADAVINEYDSYIAEYEVRIADAIGAGKQQLRVLLLMGLPGSYVVATENSYIGSLVKQAGGINVYQGESEEFISVNTEDMLARDPDIILRASHALPDKVMKMFAEEFETNDIWKHFRAVKEGRVHDLAYERFGMSARFNYPQSHNDLFVMFYG